MGYRAIGLSGVKQTVLSDYAPSGQLCYQDIGPTLLSGKTALSGYQASRAIGLSGELCYRAICLLGLQLAGQLDVLLLLLLLPPPLLLEPVLLLLMLNK